MDLREIFSAFRPTVEGVFLFSGAFLQYYNQSPMAGTFDDFEIRRSSYTDYILYVVEGYPNPPNYFTRGMEYPNFAINQGASYTETQLIPEWLQNPQPTYLLAGTVLSLLSGAAMTRRRPEE